MPARSPVAARVRRRLPDPGPADDRGAHGGADRARDRAPGRGRRLRTGRPLRARDLPRHAVGPGPRDDGRWIEFTPHDTGFAQLARTFTIVGPLAEIALGGRLALGGTTRVEGVSATTVTGTTRLLSATGTTGTAVLSIARGHRPVPLRFVGRGTAVVGPARGEVDFSRWGERIRLRTPAGAVAARSVRRSQRPGRVAAYWSTVGDLRG